MPKPLKGDAAGNERTSSKAIGAAATEADPTEGGQLGVSCLCVGSGERK